MIAGGEVLVVKGALGVMGAGNTSVLMQLLVGMLDAALARQQDLVAAEQRVAVALKVDEAPLVLNRGFAETMALKRSAGLETVACWQTDAQWSDPAVRDQLDALFAHRVYFATASVSDARAAASLTMSEFSDSVRAGIGSLSALGRPDVRLHLPKHHAIASWSTTEGRQAAFVGRTIPLRVDPARIALHAARQHARGGQAPDRPPPAPLGSAPPSPPQPARPRRSEPSRTGAVAAQSGATSRRSRDRRGELPRAARDRPRAEREVGPRAGAVRKGFEPEPLDLEMLVLIGELGHLLSSQIHRWFNPARAPSTTQRRLKRLSDAGLVERLQFHRRDGGGAPMCYRLSGEGRALLSSLGAAEDAPETDPDSPPGDGAPARARAGAPGAAADPPRDPRRRLGAVADALHGACERTDVRGRERIRAHPSGVCGRVGPGLLRPRRAAPAGWAGAARLPLQPWPAGSGRRRRGARRSSSSRRCAPTRS